MPDEHLTCPARREPGRPPHVIHVELTWQQAAGAAACLAITTAALRAARKPRLTSVSVLTRETALVVGLFALWQYAGSFALMGPDGALGRAQWIWRVERALRMPSETAIQRFFLPHPLLVQIFNLYYDVLHFPVLIACLIWLFVWHRSSYGWWRTTLVAFTGLSLLVQFIPVAPPRMLPETRMIDTGVVYHQSVYSNATGFNADQLSAMPSVHVGWAILVAIAIIATVRSRWRWLAVLYPVMTTLAVVVTANHFWLDGVAAAVILAIVLAAQTVVRRLLTGRTAAAGPASPAKQTRPLWPVVSNDNAQSGGQHRGDDHQLTRADDGAAQRVCVDDQAELGIPQVGTVHRHLAEIHPGECGSGE